MLGTSTRALEDASICLTNDMAERKLHGVALGHKVFL